MERALTMRIILYNSHRQTKPIIRDPSNKKFVFLNINLIWKLIPIPGRYKLKYKLMYWLLCIIRPIAILDINWITKYQSLYKVWSKNHGCKFIVIQHGSYMGGKVTSSAHKYTKCDELWVWGPYFKEQFEQLNPGKRVRIKIFGNPVFNEIGNIKHIRQKEENEILLLPTSLIDEKIVLKWKLLAAQIKSIGYVLKVRYHSFQKGELLQEYAQTIPRSISLYSTLKNKYSLVISDESTALLVAAFFKQSAVFLKTRDIDSAYNNYAFNIEMIDFTNFHTSFSRIYSKIEDKNTLLLDKLLTVRNSNSIDEMLLN